jgi:hypothetical protein
MPKVRQRGLSISGEAPTTRVSPGLGADVGRAVSAVGGGLEDVGSALLERKRKLEAQDKQNKFIDIQRNYDDEQRAYHLNETQLTGEESYGSIDRAEKFRKKQVETFTKDVTDDDFKTTIEGYINSRSGGMMDSLARHQAKQRDEVNTRTGGQRLEGILKDTLDGLEPIDESISRWENTITGQAAAGMLDEGKAEDIIVEGHKQIAKTSIDGLINRDPVAAVELIGSGAYDKYLSSKEMLFYDKQAKAMAKAVQADAKAQATAREKAEKDALKQQQREIGNQFVSALSEGGLTKEQILKSNLEPTGENSKEHWLKEREKYDKKVADSVDKEWKTKPEVEAEFTQRITEDPNSVKDSEITDKLGKGLDNATATKLLNFKTKRIKGEVDPVKEQEEKTAIKRLSDAKSGNFFDPADKVKNSKLWAENVNNLQRYIQNHPNEDIGDYVDQIMAPIEETWTQHFLDLASFRILGSKTGQPGKEQAIEERQKQLEAEAGERGGEEPTKIIDSLPPAETSTGKIFKDTTTGQRFRSNGNQWIGIE